MQIVRDLAGYSYGRSDLVRRAMSKKKRDVMMEERQYFIYGKEDEQGNVEIPGCLRNGISKEAAEAIFADMETFAQYAFNKSHAAAYAVVAYETGYLKKYYAVEFMAALLSSVMGDTGQTSKYIRTCEEMGIRVLPPDINESEKKYTVVDGKIRYGLLGVKNVGEHAIDEIIHARETKGIPKDIFQFINNIDVGIVNKKAVESLIKAGALDCLNPNRAAHLAVYGQLMSSAQNEARKNLAGQISLFQISGEEMSAGIGGRSLPDVRNFEPRMLLSLEKEMLGVYITGHPLNAYSDRIRKLVTVTSQELEASVAGEEEQEEGAIRESGFDSGTVSDLYDGMKVVMAGMIAGKKNLVTKNNKLMAFVDLEDLYGITEVVVFPNVYERCQDSIADDAVVVVRGKLNFKEGEVPKVLADSVVSMDEVERRARGTKGPMVKIRIPADAREPRVLKQLEQIFREDQGDTEVLIYLQNGKIVRSSVGVKMSDYLIEELNGIVGASNVKMSTGKEQ